MTERVGMKLEEEYLLEPLSAGLWWAQKCTATPERIKVHVSRSSQDRKWIAEPVDRSECMLVSETVTFVGGFHLNGGAPCRLLRRVRPAIVEPYATDEEKGRMFGKSVRFKSLKSEWRIRCVRPSGVDLTEIHDRGTLSLGSATWADLARAYEHLDGSVCGVVQEDDGT